MFWKKREFGFREKITEKTKRNAANRTRTCDMLVNSQPLYQLSYGGTVVLPNYMCRSLY